MMFPLKTWALSFFICNSTAIYGHKGRDIKLYPYTLYQHQLADVFAACIYAWIQLPKISAAVLLASRLFVFVSTFYRVI